MITPAALLLTLLMPLIGQADDGPSMDSLLAKLEATDYPADNQPVAVDLLLLSIKNDAQALSGERQHRISLEADSRLKLKGSEAELRSAFSNLVFNAVKYTPDGGEVHIRWWCNEHGAHLSVQDSGIGIEAKHLPRLTERFYRIDKGRSTATGGTPLEEEDRVGTAPEVAAFRSSSCAPLFRMTVIIARISDDPFTWRARQTLHTSW